MPSSRMLTVNKKSGSTSSRKMKKMGALKWKKMGALPKHPSKIWFPSKTEELKGFRVLLNSGIPTYATRDGKYVINDLQYNLLKENEVKVRSG